MKSIKKTKISYTLSEPPIHAQYRHPLSSIAEFSLNFGAFRPIRSRAVHQSCPSTIITRDGHFHSTSFTTGTNTVRICSWHRAGGRVKKGARGFSVQILGTLPVSVQTVTGIRPAENPRLLLTLRDISTITMCDSLLNNLQEGKVKLSFYFRSK